MAEVALKWLIITYCVNDKLLWLKTYESFR